MVELVRGSQAGWQELKAAGLLCPPAWEQSSRSQKEGAGAGWGEKLSTWELTPSQDCRCQPVQNHHLLSAKNFRFFKVKSSAQIHKSQLWHPRTWRVFCQQRCLFGALYNTWRHLRIQFSSFFQQFCCDTSAVWHPLIFVTQHSTCPISSAMTNSTNFSFFWCPAWWPCMPTRALTGIHLLKDVYTVHHLLLCCRFFALQSPLQIFTLSLHLAQHSLAGFFCWNH